MNICFYCEQSGISPFFCHSYLHFFYLPIIPFLCSYIYIHYFSEVYETLTKYRIWASSVWTNARLGLLYFNKWRKEGQGKWGSCGLAPDVLQLNGQPGDLGRIRDAVCLLWAELKLSCYYPWNGSIFLDESFLLEARSSTVALKKPEKTCQRQWLWASQVIFFMKQWGLRPAIGSNANFAACGSQVHKCPMQLRTYPVMSSQAGPAAFLWTCIVYHICNKFSSNNTFLLIKAKSDSFQCLVCVLSH